MSPIRLGVIGLSARGWAATALIPPLFDPLLKDKYTITAIATSSEASAQASTSKYSELTGHPVKGYYGPNGAKDLANDPEVDLVVVSVKVPQHWDALAPAIEAGKNFFVEWSPGRDLAETLKIAEAANAKGVKAFVGAQTSQSATARKVSARTYHQGPPLIGYRVVLMGYDYFFRSRSYLMRGRLAKSSPLARYVKI